MAKATDKKTAKSSTDYAAMMGRGFSPMTEIETDSRFYFKKQEEANILGNLIARHSRPGTEDQFFYEVECVEPCSDVTEHVMDEETNESSENLDTEGAKVGDIVRVDETHALAGPMEKVLSTGKPHVVLIQCVKKVPSKGGKSYWRMTVWAKPVETL